MKENIANVFIGIAKLVATLFIACAVLGAVDHEDSQPMYVNVLREEYETLKRKAREYDRITSEKNMKTLCEGDKK